MTASYDFIEQANQYRLRAKYGTRRYEMDARNPTPAEMARDLAEIDAEFEAARKQAEIDRICDPDISASWKQRQAEKAQRLTAAMRQE